MNIILFIFIVLAATFIAGSVNNMVTVVTALDSYLDRAEVPDYLFALNDKDATEKYVRMLEKNSYHFRRQEMRGIDPAQVSVKGEKIEYENPVCFSRLEPECMIKIFDVHDRELTEVKEGEVYLTADMINTPKYGLEIGDPLEVTVDGRTRSFRIAGSVKDAILGSGMTGLTRVLVSDSDYEYFSGQNVQMYDFISVYTDDRAFMDRFNELGGTVVLDIDRDGIKTMYMMDMIIAVVMLSVSVCLILISMVILRFTIQFTMSEEFREIGVMKAIGINNMKIRGLYITKYFAISVVGGGLGLGFSMPLGKLMLKDLSQKMIVSGEGKYYLNVLCAVMVVAVVVLFCLFCTGKVRRFSPIDAIRNGENGERYSRKTILSLGRSGFSPIPFLAVNDILCGVRRFMAMILIFALGILLIIIPVNTINTLQSDHLITMCNMAECDHVISEEQVITTDARDREGMEMKLDDIRRRLRGNGVYADVFQEILFKMTITHNEKRSSSLASQGIGDVTADQYVYLKGTAPQNTDEVAITHRISDDIGADIGDTVEIKNGESVNKYVVTAIYQTMNNLGEGIRFHPDEELDYRYAMGCFSAQVRYTDDPGSEELSDRKAMLEEIAPGAKIYKPGEYVNVMTGDVAGQLQGIKQLVLLLVLGVNVLVTVLMVKSFITKEKGEIAMLKSIGFSNPSLVFWQTMRIGIVLLLAVAIGVLVGSPVSELTSGQAFKIMGAYSIKFDIVPYEVYVMYPACVFVVTLSAAALTAIQVRNISAAETSKAE